MTQFSALLTRDGERRLRRRKLTPYYYRFNGPAVRQRAFNGKP